MSNNRRTLRPLPSVAPKGSSFKRARPIVAMPDRERITIDQARRWFIVQTHPTHEERVERRLRSTGLCECFRPLEAVRRARRGRAFTTHRHLMPRHLFIGIRPGEDPRDVVRDVQGVFDVLRINGRDVEIGSQEMQRFADVIADKIGPLRGIGKQIMAKGDLVLIVKGPFSRFPAIVVRPAKDGMVTVELKIFGRTDYFDAPLDHLIAA